jgi:hypothetical protein
MRFSFQIEAIWKCFLRLINYTRNRDTLISSHKSVVVPQPTIRTPANEHTVINEEESMDSVRNVPCDQQLLMPALHDATNAFQRWRVDSASHHVADLPFSKS